MPLNVPVASIVKVLAWGKTQPASEATPWGNYKAIKRKLQGFQNSTTPYGKLVTEVGSAWGSATVWNPSAALWYLSQLSPEFGDLLRAISRGGKATMVIAEDSFKVGNVLRPDKGRALDGVYWTLKEFPAWFRHSDVGWIPLMYVAEKELEAAECSPSSVLKLALEVTFGEIINLSTLGVLCKCSER